MSALALSPEERPRFSSIEVTNFLSYKRARFDFGDIVALVGPNAAGKSNLVAAVKLLREIPLHGLPVALARRGGFDQLRHRSQGRPNDPSLRIEFSFPGERLSWYEIRLGAVSPRSYRVKREEGVTYAGGEMNRFISDGRTVQFSESGFSDDVPLGRREFPVPPGQSALSSGGFAGYLIFQALLQMQTVEVNPSVVGNLQDPSSTLDFEPDGSNATSVYELLTPSARAELVDELGSIVPSIVRVDVSRVSDKQTFRFIQATTTGNREFSAKQMSDGTLRAFSILVAMKQPRMPQLIVIEEPEVAIHLGALRTLVQILTQDAGNAQIVLTTHSADIVDALPIDALRVVWSENGESHVGEVASHTIETVRRGLMTTGDLLRADSLDAKGGS